MKLFSLKNFLIGALMVGWGVTSWQVAKSEPVVPEPVVYYKYHNRIEVSPLVATELQEILKDVESSGYTIKTIHTLRPFTPGKFSWHNYGLAVDINPAANPCLGADCGDVSTAFAGAWVPGKNGALTKAVVDAFKKRGWCWGGDWCAKKDYMHFSKPIGLPYQDECAIAKCPYFK